MWITVVPQGNQDLQSFTSDEHLVTCNECGDIDSAT